MPSRNRLRGRVRRTAGLLASALEPAPRRREEVDEISQAATCRDEHEFGVVKGRWRKESGSSRRHSLQQLRQLQPPR